MAPEVSFFSLYMYTFSLGEWPSGNNEEPHGDQLKECSIFQQILQLKMSHFSFLTFPSIARIVCNWSVLKVVLLFVMSYPLLQNPHFSAETFWYDLHGIWQSPLSCGYCFYDYSKTGKLFSQIIFEVWRFQVLWIKMLRNFILEYKYEIEYEYDFLILT